MRYLACLSFLCLTLLPATGQTLQQLRREVDSLRLELAKCRNEPFQRISQILEDKTYPETPEYTREELQVRLLEQIKGKSADKYATALEAIGHTNRFIQYIAELKDGLLLRAGGLDSLERNPAGYRDKKIGTVYLIDEKRGVALKTAIADLRSTYLGYLSGNPDFEKRIVLVIEDTQGKPWEQYKFQGMPLAAILPILGKYQANAKSSEIAVLQFLNE